MLVVISPRNGLVYWLEPAGSRNEIREFAQNIITKGIVKFNTIHRKDIKKIKKNPTIGWQQPECPRQRVNTKDCGYYVCRYMHEIIEKRVLWISDQVFPQEHCNYSSNDIDEIRDMWVRYVLEHEKENDDGVDMEIAHWFEFSSNLLYRMIRGLKLYFVDYDSGGEFMDKCFFFVMDVDK